MPRGANFPNPNSKVHQQTSSALAKDLRNAPGSLCRSAFSLCIMASATAAKAATVGIVDSPNLLLNSTYRQPESATSNGKWPPRALYARTSTVQCSLIMVSRPDPLPTLPTLPLVGVPPSPVPYSSPCLGP